LAPIPSAKVSTAAAVNPGFRVSERKMDLNISRIPAISMPS
jgi:hypothetical protein